MENRGFTLLETLIVVGVVTMAAGITVPVYRNYQLRSDLDIAVQQTVQALNRARILSQEGQGSEQWGFSVDQGTLFKGETYDLRDPTADEEYPLPPTVDVSGLTEVVYSLIEAMPSAEGDIIFTSISGERRIVNVNGDNGLGESGILPPESMGGEEDGSESSDSGGAGDDGGDGDGDTGTGDDGGESGGDGSGTTPECADRFEVLSDGTIRTLGSVDATVKVLGSAITYGPGGPRVPVKVSVSVNGGTTWEALNTGLAVNGGEETVFGNLPAGANVVLRVSGRYSWLFNRSYDSHDDSGHIRVLKDGDTPPATVPFGNQAALASFLDEVLDETGKIDIGPFDAVILTELGTLGTSAEDFQDAVILVRFTERAGSCAETIGPRFNVRFDRIENSGQGDAGASVYVGPQATAFAESQWIPLKQGTATILDGGLQEDVPGIAVDRQNGIVKILLSGSHPIAQGGEIVDMVIVFDRVNVVDVVSDSLDPTENPFDDVVNDGSTGDEVDFTAGGREVSFRTRVTTDDDAILIRWEGAAASSSSSSSSAASTSSSAASQSSGSSTSSIDPCAATVSLSPEGVLTIGEPADLAVQVLGSAVRYGKNGPEVQVRLSASLDNGATWQQLFKYRDVDGGELQILRDVPANAQVLFKVEGRYTWLFKRTAISGDGSGRLKLLKSGDSVPATPPFLTGKLLPFLKAKIVNGTANVGSSILVLTELQDIENGDFQDLVLLLTTTKAAARGICGTDDAQESSSVSSIGSSASSTGSTEPTVTICHYPPGNTANFHTLDVPESSWTAHRGHGDRMGPCEADGDGDGVQNGSDLCADTAIPEDVPEETMFFNRYALTHGNSDVFREGPRKKISRYTLADTRGCSCEQLLDVAEGIKQYHFGQYPMLLTLMRSLFPFYTSGARQFGCGVTILNMVKNF